MSHSVYSKWSSQIDLAIRKHASGVTKETREDIEQEILLAFVQAEGKLLELDIHDQNRARGFAYTIARTTIINYIGVGHEKISRRAVSLDDPDIKKGLAWIEEGVQVCKFFGELASKISRNPPNIDIDRAMERLPEDERTVIRGLYMEGRSQQQVADDMGQTRHWIRLKKDSAIEELKRLLRN